MSHHDQFPLFRFATLLARQLSSPIANKLKVYARDHPVFGREVCGRVGRWYRVADVRLKLWTLRLAQPRAPITIPDREAIDVGTDLMGEMFIFCLGALIIIFEVNRQAMKQEAKKLDKRSRWVAIGLSLEELKVELEVQQREIDLLLEAIRELDPDVPLPQPSSLAKPLTVEPASPTAPTLMKPLPQPTPEADAHKPHLQVNPQTTSPSHSSVTKPLRPGTEPKLPKSPTSKLSDQPASIESPPDLPDSPFTPVIPPPGCVCPLALPPPPKPECPPKPPPPKAC